MKLLHKKLAYELTDLKEEIQLEDLLKIIYATYGEDYIKVIQNDEDKLVLRHLTYTRIGDTRVSISIEKHFFLFEIYEHYTAFIVFLYLLISAGILFSKGVLFFNGIVFAYCLWVLLDNHYEFKKGFIDLIETRLLK